MTKLQPSISAIDERNRLADSGPIRTCAGCGRARVATSDSIDFARVASQDGQEPVFEARHGMQRLSTGRGAWICRSERCVELAWKKRGFERVLKLKNRAPDSLKIALLQWCGSEEALRGQS